MSWRRWSVKELKNSTSRRVRLSTMTVLTSFFVLMTLCTPKRQENQRTHAER